MFIQHTTLPELLLNITDDLCCTLPLGFRVVFYKMRPIQDYPAYLLEIAFKEDVTVYELLMIAHAFALFWGLFFEAAIVLLRRLTYGRPWLRLACKREYE